MKRSWLIVLAAAAAFLLGACSAPAENLEPEEKARLETRLAKLKKENRTLQIQRNNAYAARQNLFKRAAKAEAKLGASSKQTSLLRRKSSSPRDKSVLVGPLKFDSKKASFIFSLGSGKARGSVVEHSMNGRVK